MHEPNLAGIGREGAVPECGIEAAAFLVEVSTGPPDVDRRKNVGSEDLERLGQHVPLNLRKSARASADNVPEDVVTASSDRLDRPGRCHVGVVKGLLGAAFKAGHPF